MLYISPELFNYVLQWTELEKVNEIRVRHLDFL